MKQTTIHELFRVSALRYADKVAVRFLEGRLTYAELDLHSDQFAAYLQAHGVKAGDYVGLHSEQRLELPIALLGILKVGAAYVPLDEAQPEEHVSFILNEANVNCVITSKEWTDLSTKTVLSYVVPAAEIAAYKSVSISADSVAALLYTSGTTGEPKGVMVPHRGIARLVTNADYADFSSKQVWLQHTRVAFDPSNLEIWGPLLNGGEMVVMPEQELSLRALGQAIRDYHITSTIHTTGLFHAVADACPENLSSLQQLIVGGDIISRKRCKVVLSLASDLQIINAYGPTENATITSSYSINSQNVDQDGPVPIGTAINGTEVLILDNDAQGVSVGSIGELCCAGDGVALGYLNKPKINQEKFIQQQPGQLIYRTGDLARVGEDGLLYFEGRLDQQIKLRGYRVELAEIEFALESHAEVRQAIVTAINKPDQTDKVIIAHCVSVTGGLLAQQLKEYLGQSLPRYSIPTSIHFIDEMPLDANGKVDRKKLQASVAPVELPQLPISSDQQPDQTCDLIGSIVAEVIDLESLDINANFFDLGASSLELAKIHEMLQQQLEHEFNVTKMFQYPSVILLTSYLKSNAQKTTGDISKAKQSDSRVGQENTVQQDSIAIIAMAGKFPGAEDVDAFWSNLVDGKDTITRFTTEQLEISHPEDVPAIAARGVLDGAANFDAEHFKIVPKEAAIIDPQHRVLLECAQTVLEQAAYSPEKFDGKIGIFAGCSMNTYLYNNVCADADSLRALLAGYPVNNVSTLIGNDKDFLPTRIAHKLNLTGPAVNVQSACSTSLMAVALACENLRAGHCDIALAGGVSISFPQHRDYPYTPGGIASKDGQCRPFDHHASGTVFGDGAGLVAVRRLQDALDSGDEIIAVIRGYAINNDGADKVGYTAPSVSGQVDVIRSAHQDAGVNADEIGYVETHGTATQLGDPIEITALDEAFGLESDVSKKCLIGSVKGNVGHLETAAGITSLIKTALAVKNNQIPALMHYEQANPNIDFETSRFRPAHEKVAWPIEHDTRLAGVSAFGIGGTNVHMVLQEPPTGERKDKASEYPMLYPVSASSKIALDAQVEQLKDYLLKNSELCADDVAYSLQQGRTDYACRAVGLADSESVILQGQATTPVEEIVFMFPGQGSQHLGMASGLYQNEEVFRQVVDQCSALLEDKLGLKLTDVLYPDEAQREQMADVLLNTAVAQPAIFVISFALAKQWQAWGIKPGLLLGHSIGEFVAATLAGVFELEDALDLIATRGSLMSALDGGSMLSVAIAADQVAEYLDDHVSLAVVNGAKNCVLAGPHTAIEAVAKRLDKADVVTTALHTSHAFHSSMMDPIVNRFTDKVSRLTLHPPKISIYSTVTADYLSEEQACSPEYWGNHLRKPVRFYDAINQLWDRRERIFLEVGPGNTLATLAAANPSKKTASACVASMPHAKQKTCSREHLYQAFGKLWAHGVRVDWQKIHPMSKTARRISLPTYPFQHKKHWLQSNQTELQKISKQSIKGTESVSPSSVVEEVVASSEELDTRSVLADLLSDLSGFSADQLVPSATLLELGFDSLLLTQACKDINQRFAQDLTLRQILDQYTSIDKLAAFIGELKQDNISQSKTIPARDKNDNLAIPAPQEQAVESSAPLLKISKQSDQSLSSEQQEFLSNLIKRYTGKTAQSKAKTAQHRAHYADPRTASGFNRAWKEMVYQLITVKSSGSRLLDIDGNEYIDLLNGFGPGFLGHAPDVITDALTEQLEAGFEIGPQSLLAMEAAELFCELTGNERASFVCTGSEAVQAVMRIARTVTGRDKIVVFTRDYHGNFDEVLVRPLNKNGELRSAPIAPGISGRAVADMIVLPYGTQESLEIIREQAHQLAAVMVEPVQSRRPEFQPVEFIKSLREITKASGSLLIFDEVITGLRFGPGGAQALYEVEADISTYGKVVGGGMPVGVVAGKARYMDTFDGGQWQYGDDSFPDKPVTFFAGTFVRHPMVMAATKAMLLHLKNQPPIFWKTINAKADRLAQTIDQFLQEQSVPLRMLNCGSLMFVRVLDNHPYANLLFYLLREKGVFILEGFPSYVTDSHTEQEIDYIITAFKHSVRELQGVGFFADSTYTSPTHTAWMEPLPVLQLSLDGEDHDSPEPVVQLVVDTTEAQKEIWLAMLIDNDTSLAYNESISIFLNGHVNHKNLEQALNDTFNRHDSLRSTFSADGTRMSIHEHVPFKFPMHDFSGLDKASAIEELDQLKLLEVDQAFDASNGPFVRARIIKISKLEWAVIITAHHVVCDGWSVDLLLRDCSEIYSGLCLGEDTVLPHASTMVEYVEKEQKWETSEQFKRSEDFWLTKYLNNIPVIDLPTDKPLPALKTANGARLDVIIESELIAKVKSGCSEQGVTFVNLMLAAFSLYLHRVTSQDDIVIGLPASGQAARGMEDLVGHCVNLLPLQSHYDSTSSFENFLKTIRTEMLDCFEHQYYGYGKLVSQLRTQRDPSRVFLAPVMFNSDNGIDLDKLEFADLGLRLESNPRNYEHFEWFLNILENQGEHVMQFSYNTDMFEEQAMLDHLQNYQQLLLDVVANPKQKLSEFSLLTEQHAKQQQRNSIRNSVEIPSTTFTQIFENNLSGCSAHTALIVPATNTDDEKNLSYADLNQQANQIAHYLLERGIGKGNVVGISLPRNHYLLSALLAVMKTGATYLPLDPAFPEDRLAYMLEDAQSTLVLTESSLIEQLSFISVETCALDQTSLSDYSTTDPMIEIDPLSCAYLIYTSGSTGNPKGVKISHRSMLNFLCSMQKRPGFGETDRLLAVTTLSFDIAVLELFLPLLAKGSVVLAAQRDIYEPRRLMDLLTRYDITVMQATPSTWRMLLENKWQGSKQLKILCGGEAFPQDLVDRLLLRCDSLWNMYGPTETTVWSLVKELSNANEKVTIGTAIDNTEVMILDESLRPVPNGIKGELYLGGVGLAMEYHQRPELTAEKFIEHPFSHEQGERLYRTGDLARRLQSGEIECLGRIDHQVKVRGFRIELGEIESVINALEGVNVAAVVCEQQGTVNARLVAWVVLEADADLKTLALREKLRQKLPDYMVPALVQVIEQLPTTLNGKIDRNALPQSKQDTNALPLGVTTKVERDLLDIWQDILAVQDISPAANFFELGGHSLLAVRMFNQVHERFGIELPIATLFENPTIRMLAPLLESTEKTKSIDVEEDWPTTVVIHAGGSGRPLFMVGGIGGNVNNLYEFGKAMGQHRPMIGLQARGVLGHNMRDSIEEVAAEHIRYMKDHQASGPYFLSGYSAGGVVAFEMARQLNAANEMVGFLGLIDTVSPVFNPISRLERSASLERWVEMIKRDGLKKNIIWQAQNIFDKLAPKQLKNFLQKHTSPEEAEYQRWVDHWFKIEENYHGGQYTGSVTLIRGAADSYRDQEVLEADPTYSWDQLIEGHVDELQADLNHLDLMLQENVQWLVDQINKRLVYVE